MVYMQIKKLFIIDTYKLLLLPEVTWGNKKFGMIASNW